MPNPNTVDIYCFGLSEISKAIEGSKYGRLDYCFSVAWILKLQHTYFTELKEGIGVQFWMKIPKQIADKNFNYEILSCGHLIKFVETIFVTVLILKRFLYFHKFFKPNLAVFLYYRFYDKTVPSFDIGDILSQNRFVEHVVKGDFLEDYCTSFHWIIFLHFELLKIRENVLFYSRTWQ